MPQQRPHTRLYYAFWHRLEGAVISVATTEPVAALPFDDGPHPEFTPRLLDILAKRGARATFFMVGQAAARHPQVVRRVAEAGCAIGNHSWDHPSFPALGRRQRWRQVRQTQAALAPYGSRLFRPPYGHLDRRCHLDLRLLGYTVAAWNITGYDWLDHDPAWLSQNIRDQLRPGSIILLHDAAWMTLDQGWADRGPMLAAVDELLASLSGRFRFVTLPDLLRYGRAQLRIWQKPADPAFMAQLQPVA